MKVVLVNIGVFQEYILYCIKQLQNYGNNDITIITNSEFFDKYIVLENTENIELVPSEELDDMNYHLFSGMSRDFRDGFAFYTSQRLFLIYSYMKYYGIKDCVHIENDNMIYENLDAIFPGSPVSINVCAVFDSPKKVIASIIYIPSIYALEELLKQYNMGLNDMENLGMRADAIEKLPIIPLIKDYTEPNYTIGIPYAQNFGRFGKKHIFDGAAIGQYFGGIDPRNTTEKNTRGFINETCVVKFNNFNFTWLDSDEDGLYRPYLIVNGDEYPIVNLHIHSKKLSEFYCDFTTSSTPQNFDFTTSSTP